MDVIQVGNIMPSKWGEQTNQGRVYNKYGLCPTLNTMSGGGRQPYIVVRYGAEVIKIRVANKQGYVPYKMGGVVDLSYPSSKTRRGRCEAYGQISPTICAELTLYVIESKKVGTRV